MKPKTTDDVLELLDLSFPSAALGAALELGLFWRLDENPMDAAGVAGEYGIPEARCGYWLQLLEGSGLLVQGDKGYVPSPEARESILGAMSRDSWSLLAEESRGRLPGLVDLATHIRVPSSAWEVMGLRERDYVRRMADDPAEARRFTRMLYEIHRPLAEALAGFLELDGVERLMDLGGGSGVLSIAIARRHPQVSPVVVDIAAVCDVGRGIAAAEGLAGRVEYAPANFVEEELPFGFDAVLECDVNYYSDDLFIKVHRALKPGGRFVIIDQLAPAEGMAPFSRVHWAFEGSMRRPDFAFLTAAGIRGMLEKAGFRILSEKALPEVPGPCRRFTQGMVVIEATS